MTVWHSLPSFNAHLAHLASPVMVSASAAKVRTAVAAKNSAAMHATEANDFFIVCFLFFYASKLCWQNDRQTHQPLRSRTRSECLQTGQDLRSIRNNLSGHAI